MAGGKIIIGVTDKRKIKGINDFDIIMQMDRISNILLSSLFLCHLLCINLFDSIDDVVKEYKLNLNEIIDKLNNAIKQI